MRELQKVDKLIFVPILVLLDYFSKLYFKSSSILNTGIIFGSFQGYNTLWIIVTLIVIGILVYYYNKEKEYRVGLVLIISGAIGNLIDRFLYSGVVDFIHLGFWPAFNLADSYNVIGVVLIFILMYKK